MRSNRVRGTSTAFNYFSQISSIVIPSSKSTIELTFENFHHTRNSAWRLRQQLLENLKNQLILQYSVYNVCTANFWEISSYEEPPASMSLYKICKGWPFQDAPIRCWYNCGTNHFHQADFCLAEMKKPTVLSNNWSNAWSCAEDQIFVGFLRINPRNMILNICIER